MPKEQRFVIVSDSLGVYIDRVEKFMSNAPAGHMFLHGNFSDGSLCAVELTEGVSARTFDKRSGQTQMRFLYNHFRDAGQAEMLGYLRLFAVDADVRQPNTPSTTPCTRASRRELEHNLLIPAIPCKNES